MMRCPYCNCELQEGSKFCDKCGQEIPTAVGVSQASKNYWEDYQSKTSKDVSAYQAKMQKENDEQKAKRNKIILLILASACAIVLIIYMTVIHPAQQYSKATELLDSGEFVEAMAIFEGLGNYKDSGEQLVKCQEEITEQRYQDGLAKYKNGNYEEARVIFEELGSYKACQSFLHECYLQIGWEIESNNTSQTANIVPLNKEHFGTLESNYNSEQDWYKFSLEAPGRVILIFNSAKQSTDDAYWDVSIRSKNDPEEDLWQEYIHGNTTKTESIPLSLSEGTHYIEIESSNMHSSDTYSFEVVYEESDGVWEIESNNTYQTATSIFLNEEYLGVLQSEWETEQDWYAFTLETDDRVSLVFNSEKQSSDDAYWDISIRSKNDPEEDLWQKYIYGHTTTTESDSLSLSAGTYYVEVESSNSHSSDTYSFKVVQID